MRGTPTIVIADTAGGRRAVKRGLASGRDLDAAMAEVLATTTKEGQTRAK